MKKYLVGSMTVILALLTLGMGSTPPGEIPSPRKDFRAIITDTDGMSSQVTSLSFHGEIYLDGKHGRATVAIPFDKISRIVFEEAGEGEDAPEDSVQAKITLTDGSTTLLSVSAYLKWTGKTNFGNMVIRTEDVGSISFPR